MGKKVIRLTESDLVKIVKRVIEEEQSFSDKLKQKMLFFRPLKLTDDRKLKLFEFVVDSIESGNYTVDAYRNTVLDANLVIHSNDKTVIDGIKTSASIVVVNVRRKTETGRIPSYDVIVRIPQHTKGYGDMSFMDDNDPLFQKFVKLCHNILKTDKRTRIELERPPIDFSRTSPPDKEEEDDTPIRRYRSSNDFNSYGYTDDDDNKFDGFGGGSFGGGGAGSDF